MTRFSPVASSSETMNQLLSTAYEVKPKMMAKWKLITGYLSDLTRNHFTFEAD